MFVFNSVDHLRGPQISTCKRVPAPPNIFLAYRVLTINSNQRCKICPQCWMEKKPTHIKGTNWHWPPLWNYGSVEITFSLSDDNIPSSPFVTLSLQLPGSGWWRSINGKYTTRHPTKMHQLVSPVSTYEARLWQSLSEQSVVGVEVAPKITGIFVANVWLIQHQSNVRLIQQQSNVWSLKHQSNV